jgi:NADH dehydrogenase/NADH:ubiquinone oxidoreductase subunit G
MSKTHEKAITIDGKTVLFSEGQTIMDAALAAGVYIPRLCHNPQFQPHGSCKLCVVNASGRNVTACTMPASNGMVVGNNTKCRFSIGCSSEIGENEGSQSLSITPGDPG